MSFVGGACGASEYVRLNEELVPTPVHLTYKMNGLSVISHGSRYLAWIRMTISGGMLKMHFFCDNLSIRISI